MSKQCINCQYFKNSLKEITGTIGGSTYTHKKPTAGEVIMKDRDGKPVLDKEGNQVIVEFAVCQHTETTHGDIKIGRCRTALIQDLDTREEIDSGVMVFADDSCPNFKAR